MLGGQTSGSVQVPSTRLAGVTGLPIPVAPMACDPYVDLMHQPEFPRRPDPTQPYAPPSVDDHDGQWDAFGDSGPWTWLLAETWQQAAAPDLFAGPLRRPGLPFAPETHFDVVAYWAPLLNLTTYGLGWHRPEIGLWRWRHEGTPLEHPILTTLDRRYGDDLDLMMAWLATTQPGTWSGMATSGSQEQPLAMKRHCEAVRATAAYRAQFTGGGDPMHLYSHMSVGQSSMTEAPQEVAARRVEGLHIGDGPVDYLLVGPRYHDLFVALRHDVVPHTTGGRSTRVAVVWPTGGWLGNYRRSRETGMWFRGRHAVHMLGNP